VTGQDDDAAATRAQMRDSWERVAPGWGEQAAVMRAWGMPVTSWMIDHADLQPGQRVLELAAGAGDVAFLAAEIVAPGGGTVICSDGAEAMVDVARQRARELGVRGVEFRQLELEWIDLPTADVDRILCRWGLMLILDPGACLSECRRVLRPGGRIAVATWDVAEVNPWMTLPRQALAEAAGVAVQPPIPGPGPFALASREKLLELFSDAGFVDVAVEAVELQRTVADARTYLEETLALSMTFREQWERLDAATRERTAERLAELGEAASHGGQLLLRGRTLAATASA
jgi:ubiquinone/menaquinone biosynthesis C-methylase UbiE